MTDVDSERKFGLPQRLPISRGALENGAFAGFMCLLYAGLYIVAGFEMTIISMLAVIMVQVMLP